MDAVNTFQAALALFICAVPDSSRETILLDVPARAPHDPLICRQDMIAAGRAELARRGVSHGAVWFLGAKLLDVGEPVPIAADAADDLRLASWR